jgi:CSLREA domain-containing protein
LAVLSAESGALPSKLGRGRKFGTLVVTTFADVIDANDGVLSLREAVIHANSNAGDFRISAPAGYIQ